MCEQMCVLKGLDVLDRTLLVLSNNIVPKITYERVQNDFSAIQNIRVPECTNEKGRIQNE